MRDTLAVRHLSGEGEFATTYAKHRLRINVTVYYYYYYYSLFLLFYFFFFLAF